MASQKNSILTQSYLKEILHYDPETGIFTRIIDRHYMHKKGAVLGSVTVGGYMAINLDALPRPSHRLAWLYMYGEFPKGQIDHINHDRTDNRIKNLRVVSHKENGRNQKLGSNNTSGVNGVHWDKARKKWKAIIKVNYKNIQLGRFDNFFDAVCARKSADIRYGFHPNHGLDVTS